MDISSYVFQGTNQYSGILRRQIVCPVISGESLGQALVCGGRCAIPT